MTPFRYLLFFCGQVGMMSLIRYFFTWIVDFSAVEKAGAPLFVGAAITGAIFGFRIFDGITDPLAGTLSDAWIKRGKKRQHLLWFALFLPALGLMLTFAPTHDMAAGLKWTLALAGMFLFFTGYTFYAIPYWSLVDDYSQGDHGRRRLLSSLLGAGMLVASGIGFVVSPLLLKPFGFSGGAVIFGIGAIILMALPIFAAPRTPDGRQRGDHGDDASLIAGAKAALSDRRFLALLALYGGSQMSFTIMTSAAPFIVMDLLDSERSKVALLLGPLLGVAILSFFLVPKLSHRFGWMHAMLMASILLAVVYALTGFLGASWFGSPIITAGVVFALSGPMIAVLLGLEGEGIVDCANARGGDRYVGMYWGVFNFVVKILNGAALFALGVLTDLRASWGDQAVRSMSFLAGTCLLIGVGLYYAIRPHKKKAA